MARIRKIEIANFRAHPAARPGARAGHKLLDRPGDSGKSTVLDAIDLCLGARRNVQFSDADSGLDITKPISITLTIGDITMPWRTLESFGAFLRGFTPPPASVETEATSRCGSRALPEPDRRE